MPHRIVHPTKEQVRAYMVAREAARLPPPPPDEIRRQLNWRLEPPDEQFSLTRFYLIPTNCTQAAGSALWEWWVGRLRQYYAGWRYFEIFNQK